MLTQIQEGMTLPDGREVHNNNMVEIQDRLVSLETDLGQIRFGTADPTEAVGNTNDFYIQYGDNSFLWGPKSIGGTWGAPRPIKGDRGIRMKGMWANNIAYGEGDGVMHRNSFWIANEPVIGTEPRTDTFEVWDLVAVGWNWRGAWVAATAYQVNDIVTNGGHTYRLNDNVTSSTAPPAAGDATYNRISQKGEKGDTGDAGKTVHNGTATPPAAGTGTDGDFYINTSTWMIYGPKAAGAWPAGVSLVGATGATGAGVPTGGAAKNTLRKVDATNFNTSWGWLKVPFFLYVSKTTTGTAIGTSTAEDIIYPTSDRNIGFTYNAATGIATVPVAGFYLVQAYQVFATSAGITTIAVAKGGVQVEQIAGIRVPSSTAYLSGSLIVECAANNTLSIQATSSDAATTINTGWMQITFLGEA